ncbi:proteasome assembly chaperone family protein [Cellulomonas xiejunii]|uniref:PAC2 family protein n=1 Tax=Cellulomonas xiejunii TaxID=2968083 RepID=A0ABY5KV47_9CELL|nr:PAC2 family protein [Cellulomonas xiejunii]MCC2316006.1 PAC2 family protein [Cellulomonas xiejunii]MCC2322039.1 PAC2 family protein [Cellulomonas xiejunii]UUI73331.1 PAC2 family protein [Cellulomonas xiejunii]
MLDPRDIYDVDVDAAERVDAAARNGAAPVLVHALQGFVDAGHAGQVAVEHLVGMGPSRRLVTFDVDQLVDYRSRRPVMTFDSGWTHYAAPELAVDLLEDAQGVPYLLLHGVEPDTQWERWVAAVRQVVERFDVPLVVGLHGIPMAVPHTRPVSVTAHATRPELVADHTSFFGTVQVPGSASALLEMRLGESGHDAMGFAVHVPHYLAQAPFPSAGLAGLRHVERATGLDLGLAALQPAAAESLREIERQVEGSTEVAAVVQALEEQYDAFTRSVGRTSLLAQATDLPTAEEIGAELERFLAEQAEPPDGGDGTA